LAEAAAERLLTLAPGAGHLVHMPSHIFRRLGRYADASLTNEMAIAADEDYITQCRAQGVYPLAYYPHNVHFLWDSTSMEGRSRDSIEAALKVASRIPEEAWRSMPLLQQFLVAPLFAYTRFGKWPEILKEPAPPQDEHFLRGVWHYARGLAYIATIRLEDASRELGHLQQIAAMDSLKGLQVTFSRNGARAILEIAVEVLAGELAAARGDLEQAIVRLHRGVLLEDNLIYMGLQEWGLVLGLSVIWGGTFFFVAVAVKALPPLTLVFLRVALAAGVLALLVPAVGLRLPGDRKTWSAFFGIGLLNNVIPFSLIF